MKDFSSMHTVLAKTATCRGNSKIGHVKDKYLNRVVMKHVRNAQGIKVKFESRVRCIV